MRKTTLNGSMLTNGNFGRANVGLESGDKKPSTIPTQNARPVGQQSVTRERNDGLTNAALGYVVGSTLANQHVHAAPVNSSNEDVAAARNVEEVSYNQSMPKEDKVEERESFFMQMVSFIFWSAVIIGIILAIFKIMVSRKNRFNKAANYTL
ncbi:MAG: hypothetical protein EOO38_07030 [Cytophagaceae bacterium]|nr:MAG: hypothetical protein EOO38_07030 [Cytophagaceae bacterium]